MEVNAVNRLVISMVLCFVPCAFATDCTPKYKDCNGIEQTTEWTCVNCLGFPANGTCLGVPVIRDPNTPQACIVTVSGTCVACVYP